MLDVKQFRELVVRPTLERIGLWSEAAENLLVGTAIQESRLKYLKQKGAGPALGVYQIEPATHADVWINFLRFKPAKANVVMGLVHRHVDDRHMGYSDNLALVYDLAYATAIARIIYYRRPEPLPPADDIDALAAYWKQHYNTPLGAGTAEEWAANYRRYAA